MNASVYLVSFLIIIFIVMIVSAVITFKITKKGLCEKVKLDITPEDMKKLEDRINNFLKENNLGTDQSIFEVAKVLKVEQGGVEPGLKDQGYLKECKNQKKVVVFKENLTEKERNFVFAHEIAHLINGDKIPVTRPVGRHKSKVEQLADYTAAALLMPRDTIYAYLENSKYRQASIKKRAAILKELCKQYNVTELIALRRIEEVYVLEQNYK